MKLSVLIILFFASVRAFAQEIPPFFRCSISYPAGTTGVVEYQPEVPSIIQYDRQAGSSDPQSVAKIIIDQDHVSGYPLKLSRCKLEDLTGNGTYGFKYKCGNYADGAVDFEMTERTGFVKYNFLAEGLRGVLLAEECVNLRAR